jgi:type II secretion system protein C
MAKKDLGLLLVGTVVAYDSRLSRAFIDNRKSRQQETYDEGDKAGEVQIIKILRNKVIIATKEGDKLLTFESEGTAIRSKTATYGGRTPGSANIPPQIPSQMPAARTSSITLDRQEVESAFEDSEKILQEVGVSPYMQGDQSAGFRLNSIQANNILRKMGMRSRDVIVGVNGEAISDPEQVEDFIRTLGEGGEVIITIKRRRRTRQLKLNIE